jgi:hypothetical protein
MGFAGSLPDILPDFVYVTPWGKAVNAESLAAAHDSGLMLDPNLDVEQKELLRVELMHGLVPTLIANEATQGFGKFIGSSTARTLPKVFSGTFKVGALKIGGGKIFGRVIPTLIATEGVTIPRVTALQRVLASRAVRTFAVSPEARERYIQLTLRSGGRFGKFFLNKTGTGFNLLGRTMLGLNPLGRVVEHGMNMADFMVTQTLLESAVESTMFWDREYIDHAIKSLPTNIYSGFMMGGIMGAGPASILGAWRGQVSLGHGRGHYNFNDKIKAAWAESPQLAARQLRILLNLMASFGLHMELLRALLQPLWAVTKKRPVGRLLDWGLLQKMPLRL